MQILASAWILDPITKIGVAHMHLLDKEMKSPD